MSTTEGKCEKNMWVVRWVGVGDRTGGLVCGGREGGREGRKEPSKDPPFIGFKSAWQFLEAGRLDGV